MTRKRSAYRPRVINVPVTKGLHDEIALQMRLAYVVGNSDQLRDIFNMVGVAISGDVRFAEEVGVINAGAQALTGDGLRPIVLAAVNEIDALLPRLDVTRLHMANMKLRKL